MKRLLLLSWILLTASLIASEKTVEAIIDDARAIVGSETDLNRLVTLKISGRIEPAELKQLNTRYTLIAREPCSQRLEVRTGNTVEITLLKGSSGYFILSDLHDAHKRPQFRKMTTEEICRMAFNTRQLFNFYREDVENGESIHYAGIEQRCDIDCHKLVYTNSDGISTTRYFSVDRKVLVSTITDKGVENIEVGEQIIDGIRFPQKIEYYQDGKLLHTMVLEVIEVNKPLRAGIFNMPFIPETK